MFDQRNNGNHQLDSVTGWPNELRILIEEGEVSCLNVTTITVPLWPPIRIVNSSVTTSSVLPRGMIAAKFTANVITALWLVYLTTKPAGIAGIKRMTSHDDKRITFTWPHSV